MDSKYIINKKDLKSASLYAPSWFIFGAISIYIFLSFYESFLPGILASSTKYYLIPLAVIVLLSYRTVTFKYYHFAILAWLGLKFISILWAWNGINATVKTNAMSQISMVTLFIILTLVDYEQTWVNRLIVVMEAVSASMGFLMLFFAQPYASSLKDGESAGRNVLTLFGNQGDPNNQAAFFAVGVALGMYFIFSARKYIWLNAIVVILNTFAIVQTGSRGGLIVLAAICLVMIFIPSSSEKKMPVLLRIVVLTLVALAAAFVAVRYADAVSVERLLDFEGLSESGGSGRTDIWKNVSELFWTSPVFGAGWGSYRGYNGMTSIVHNTYLENLCSTGILGTILLFTPIVEALRTGIKRRKYIVIPIVVVGLVPCFFLDAIIKRFFWNAFFFAMVAARAVDTKEDEEKRDVGHRSVKSYIFKHTEERKSKYIK